MRRCVDFQEHEHMTCKVNREPWNGGWASGTGRVDKRRHCEDKDTKTPFHPASSRWIPSSVQRWWACRPRHRWPPGAAATDEVSGWGSPRGTLCTVPHAPSCSGTRGTTWRVHSATPAEWHNKVSDEVTSRQQVHHTFSFSVYKDTLQK